MAYPLPSKLLSKRTPEIRVEKKEKPSGGPHAEGAEKPNGTEKPKAPTSSNREESMAESGEDSFAPGATRAPDTSDQGDGTAEDPDMTVVGQPGRQNPSTSGTTSLGGESSESFSAQEEEVEGN
ncbi:MAG: hypothetical protein H0U59_00430 [Gemmatimonadaceae bacterium]|nr:hypothetical protein [Gemmatimonadaceae bacterium]MDQ3242354.1 hypothetical protein [Gemmatimonadota bacterium]